jgi:MATE family multidrug resistance protein
MSTLARGPVPAVRVSLPGDSRTPIVSVWSFQLDGIFIGTTRTTEMRNGMLLATAGYLLAVETLVPLLHNHGLWLR